MTEAQIVLRVISTIEALISLASALGARDAAIAALDGVLAAARAQTDADMARRKAPGA